MPSPAKLSVRAKWAGGEPIANLLMSKALAHPELVSLAAGFVDHETLPVEAADQAWKHLFSQPSDARAALQYGTTIGHPPLREALVERLRIADGEPAGPVHLDAKQVVVTAGSNQLLFLVADVLLDPGDYCYGERAPRHMLRLSFGSPTTDDIRRGIAALARALRQVMP